LCGPAIDAGRFSGRKEMKMGARLGFRIVVLGLMLAGVPREVFAEHRFVTGTGPEAFVRQTPSPRMLRERSITLDRAAPGRAAADASPFLDIAFFDDAVFRILVKGSEPTHSGGVGYFGQVITVPHSRVVIVDNDGTVSVNFSVPGRRFTIQGSIERGYIARELVDADLPDHDPGYGPSGPQLPYPAPHGKSAPTYAPPPSTARDDGSTIDVAVVYTPAARASASGTAQMHAYIDAEILDTNNQIYANSNVVQRLRLVYKGEVNHTEAADMEDDLTRLALTSDGFLDEVPLLRNLYAADFVSLWGNYPSGTSCGIGFLMTTESAGFAPNAYNVVYSGACTGAGATTFAHELGHNMGLRHDNYKDTTAITNVTPEGSATPVNITYAHGYIDLVNRFRTVMSYNDQCAAAGYSCYRIPYFSNPSISYNNSSFYVSAVLAPTGNASTAHERQALNDTRETTANFRTALSTFTGPGIFSFLPTSYAVAESGGSVVLTVGRHVGSTGTVTVNYSTVNGTATAGSDFTAVAGTLTWNAGDTTNRTITVPIAQDAVLEGNETLTVTLSAPTGGATISPAGATATVRILDDEPDTFPVGGSLPAGYTSPNNPNPNTTNTSWTVDTANGYLSTSSLQSAQVLAPDATFTTFGNSDLEYAGTFNAGTVTFHYKLSSYQGGYSGFEFQIDGVAVFANNVGGEVDWTLVSQPISAGPHTLRWRFKNRLPFPCRNVISPEPATGGANCADRAWIDNVSLPVASSGPYLLTVALAGTGTGTVSSSPAGISCGGDCAESYAGGTPVTVTAAPAAGSVFSGWSGGGCSGTGQCTVTMNAATSVTATFSLSSNPPRLVAISTRTQVLTGDNVMIGGFIIGGSSPKTVVVRARGPSLGVVGALADPTLTLVPASGPATLNDDWGTAANAATLAASGYAPADAKESAIMATLNPGAYTAIVGGVGNTTGVAIVEVYEMDHPEIPQVAISTRALVQTGDNVMIGGFIIQGSGPQTVVVRARGPSLGVAGALADPTLTLVPSSGPAIVNDDWGTAANAATLAASGYAPANAKESAILVTLNPGAYTAIVSGVGNTTGVAIVEVYRQ